MIFWSPGEDEFVPVTEQVAEEGEVVEGVTVTEGDYVVDLEASEILWAGQKPLIDGYVNTGSLSLKSATISVTDEGFGGELVMDMNLLQSFSDLFD